MSQQDMSRNRGSLLNVCTYKVSPYMEIRPCYYCLIKDPLTAQPATDYSVSTYEKTVYKRYYCLNHDYKELH